MMLPRVRRALILVATLPTIALPAHALEKTARRIGDLEQPDTWSRSSTALVSYYNICTGWVWLWPMPSLQNGERIGQVFGTSSSTTLLTTWALTFSGAPCGYGYSGTLEIHDVDSNDCPIDPYIARQPFCLSLAGWVPTSWGDLQVPSRFALVVTRNRQYVDGYVTTDHPAPGPTGPISCGTCYPTTRATHSYYWGSATSPLCPGEPMFDGFCNAEFLFYAQLEGPPTSVENSTWGKIKALFR